MVNNSFAGMAGLQKSLDAADMPGNVGAAARAAVPHRTALPKRGLVFFPSST
jgi:hypothetical protein